MNEFKLFPKESLPDVLSNLQSYKKGCEDTLKLFLELHKETINLYDEKIRLCKLEIGEL